MKYKKRSGVKSYLKRLKLKVTQTERTYCIRKHAIKPVLFLSIGIVIEKLCVLAQTSNLFSLKKKKIFEKKKPSGLSNIFTSIKVGLFSSVYRFVHRSEISDLRFIFTAFKVKVGANLSHNSTQPEFGISFSLPSLSVCVNVCE